jgi:uncharacterized protein
MPEGNVEVVRGAYEAFGRQDIPAVLSIMRDDIEWHVPTVVPQGMDVEGTGGVGKFFQGLAEHWQDLQVDVEGFLTSEDQVAAIVSVKGKLGGVERSYGAVHLWTLESGKAVRFREYVDVERDAFAGTG